MKKQVFLILCIALGFGLRSQTYYFRASATAANNQWTNPLCWVTNPLHLYAGASSGVAPNSPSHNVIFDDLSDNNAGAAVVTTIIYPTTGVLSVGDFSFTCTNTGATAPIFSGGGGGGNIFRIYGNVTFANSTCPNLGSFNAAIEFRSIVAGATNTIDTKGVSLRSTTLFTSSNCTFNVASTFVSNSNVYVGDNANSFYPTVNFQQDFLTNSSATSLQLFNGNLTMSGNISGASGAVGYPSELFVASPVGTYTTGLNRIFVNTNGLAVVTPTLNLTAGKKYNIGSVSIFQNCKVNASGVEINTQQMGIQSNGTTSNINFSNSIINYSYYFQNIVIAPALASQCNFTGSTITGKSLDNTIYNTCYFAGGGCAYNKVYLKKFVNMQADQSTTLANATTYNDLRYYDGATMASGGTASSLFGAFTPNANLYLSIPVGGFLQFNGGSYSSANPPCVINIAPTATLDLNGSCSKPNRFVYVNFTMSANPGSPVTGDYNKFETSPITSVGVSKYCGANSYKVPNTNAIGWFIDAGLTIPLGSPAKRTLYWAGPIPVAVGTNTTAYSNTTLAAFTATNTYDYYGRWSDAENWSTNPASVPGNNLSIGGTCPPTQADSVIMPDHSYVRFTKPYAEVGDFRWQGRGIMADTNYASRSTRTFEIYGSCYFFDTKTAYNYYQNRFRGVVQFRTNKTYPLIQSANNPFNYYVNFNATNGINGRWSLVDSLTTLPEINFTGGALPEQRGTATNGYFAISSGILTTNGNNINADNFVFTGSAILNLGASKIYIHYPWNVNVTLTGGFTPFWNNSGSTPNAVSAPWINAGTSQIHILARVNVPYGSPDNIEQGLSGGFKHTGFTSPGGFTYYDVILYGPNPSLQASRTTGRIDNFNSITFRQSGTVLQTIATTTVNIGTLTTNATTASVSYTMLMDNYFPATAKLNIGTAWYKKNTQINGPITYTTSMRYEPGFSYKLNCAPTASTCNQTIASTATMVAMGTCSKMITIDGGKFINQNGATQNCDNLILSNNDATGGGGFNFGSATSVALGTVTGWTGTPRPANTYYWVDNTPGISSFKWNDCTHWSNTSGGTTGTIGIPSSIDNVVFDNNSFTTANDTIEIDPQAYANCNNMTWSNTNFKGVLKGKDSTCVLNVFGGMTLNTNMDNKFYGEVNFNNISATTNSITSANNTFNWKVNFNGNAAAEWVLQDKLQTYLTQWNSPTNRYWKKSVNLMQGKLNTNNQPVVTEIFTSNGTANRVLTAGTSSITIFGKNVTYSGNSSPYPDGVNIAVWEVSGSGYTIDAKYSKIVFMGNTVAYANILNTSFNNRIMLGQNQHYGTIATTFTNTGFSLDGYKDTINVINVGSREFFIGVNGAGSLIPANEGVEKLPSNTSGNSGYTAMSGISKLKIGTLNFSYSLLTPSSLHVINSYYNDIDSMICGNNTYFQSNNKYYDLLFFTPGFTQRLLPGTVQWVQNRCEFKPIGTSANNINFNSTSTGAIAYVRKDSSIVCSNYINVRDINMIGNGGVYANTYASPGATLTAGQTYTLNPSATAADADCFGNFGNTLKDTTLSCGVTTYSTALGHGSTYWPLYTTTSGRADFQAGTFAVPNSYATQAPLNVAGWSFNPTSATPQLSVTSTNTTVCEGDSIKLTFKVIGFPIQKITYQYSTDGGVTRVDVDSLPGSGQVHYTSGNGINPTPYIWSIWVKPTTTTIYYAGNTTIDQCFNNVGIGAGQVQITVNQAPLAPTGTIVPSSHLVCLGQTFTVTATPPAGVSVTWTTTPTGTTSINTSANTYTNNTAAAGSYTYYAMSTATATGCKSILRTPVTVTVNPIAAITLTATSANPVCAGTNAIISYTASNTTAVNLYTVSTGGSSQGTFIGNNYTVTPAAGTYTYYLQANNATSGCNAAGARPMVTLTVNPTPAMSSANTATICSGASLNIPLTSAVASTYSWLATDNANTTGESLSTQTTATVNNTVVNTSTLVQTVIYTVTPSATTGGCAGAAQTVTVTVNPTPQVTSTATIAVCSGVPLNIPITSNVVSTYTWIASNNAAVAGESLTNQVTATITNTLTTAAGSGTQLVIYTITPVSTAGACAGTVQQMSVTVNALPSISITGNTVLCSGNSTTLTALTADTYSWSNGTTTSQNIVSPTTNTVYTAIGTNTYAAGNCTISAAYNVNVNATPTLAVTGSTVVCSGNSTTLTALTANTYSWSNGPMTSQNIVSPTTNTVYTAIGTNTYAAGNCSTSATYSVNVNVTPTLAITGGTVLCSGNSTTLTALIADTYSWSNGTTTSQNIVSPTTNTVYTAIGTNTYAAGNCTISATYSINVNATPTLAVTGSAVLCTGNSATLTALTANTYSWNNGPTTSQNIVSPTINTVYTVTGTNTYAAGNCSTSATYSVNVNALPTVSITGNAQICSGETSTLTASGANTYNWISPASTATVLTVSPLVTTMYTVTGTSAAGNCTNAAVYSVSVANTPTINLTPNSAFICAGNTTTLAAVSNGGTTYNWSGPGIISGAGTATITVDAGGTYSVTASQTTGTLTCTTATSAIASVTVGPTPAAPNVAVTGPYCNPAAVAMSVSNITGGVNYGWYTLSTGGSALVTNTSYTATGLATGTYTYYTESQAGTCTSTSRTPVTFTVYAVPGAPTVTPVQYCQGETATPLNASGTNLIWASATGTTITAPTPLTGVTGNTTYTVTQIVNGCTSAGSQMLVTVNPTATVIIPGQAGICNGELSVLTSTATGSGQSYQWYNGAGAITGATAATYTSSVSGNYYVVVTTTPGNCAAMSNTSTVNVSESPTVAVTSNTTVICATTGEAQLDAGSSQAGSGTITNYQWMIDHQLVGSNNPVYKTEPGKKGSYNVIITNSNGCRDSADVAITISTYDCDLVIPEIYSPNGDGKNDTWEIKGLDNYPANNVQVFNRWGDEVFNAAPYNNDWKGSNKGSKSILGQGLLPVGTYYFILDLGNGNKPLTGYVQITK